MVFESVVTDILNKILGDYVLNLDKKQLKIGIWGGDVELKDLKLRENAFDEFNLPFQLTHGYLGKLVLKIPWKNLYSQPVVAQIDDFYMIVSPKQSVEYDEEKEASYELQAKQATLKKIEDARKAELMKEQTKGADTFTEKLTAQIVNNLQVQITNVHLRYEDTMTTGQPFAFGVTLHELDIHTTNENWVKTYIAEQISKVYKIANLDCLSIYMNCGDVLYGQRDKSELNQLFKSNIATKEAAANNTYIFGPISSMAKLQLNMNPQFDNPPFIIPKIDLDVGVEKLNISLTRRQFQSILKLGDSVNRIQLGLPYRKYRPHNKPYKGHYKEWWRFAITSVLEEDIRKKRASWCWESIKQHRETCLTYASAFKEKELAKKPTSNLLETCTLCEQKLDIFNLILIRNRVYLEVSKIKEKEQENQNTGGWFSGWWGGSNKSQSTESGDIIKKLEAAMTADEKEKLYNAIGYQENAVDLTLPEEYEAIKGSFRLTTLEIGVFNEIENPLTSRKNQLQLKNIMLLKFSSFNCNFTQRPAANAIRVVAGVKKMELTGMKQADIEPVLIDSVVTYDDNLLDVLFETNPVDKTCDQRVKMSARPLEVIYDAETVNELMQIFTTTESVNLSEFEVAASQRLLDFKERSATGIQFIVDKHPILDIDIKLMPNIFIVPVNGSFKKDNASMIVVSLGQLHIKTEPRPAKDVDVAKMSEAGLNKDDILKNMMTLAYDKFKISVEDVQVLVLKKSEIWTNGLLNTLTEMHILRPTSLIVTAEVCVVKNDPRLPQNKVTIVLPSISFRVAEDRIFEAFHILKSLPIMNKPKPEPVLPRKVSRTASRLSLSKLFDQEKIQKGNKNKANETLPSETVQYTQLQLSFVLNEIKLTLHKSCESKNSDETPSDKYGTPLGEGEMQLEEFKELTNGGDLTAREKDMLLSFQVLQVEMNVSKRFYDMSAFAKLGAINITQYDEICSSPHVCTIIDTPKFARDSAEYLLSISYNMVDKKSPEFIDTEQLLQVDFSTLAVTLHQECLLKLMETADSLQKKFDEINRHFEITDNIATVLESGEELVRSFSNRQLYTISESGPHKRGHHSKKNDELITFKFVANLEQVVVNIVCGEQPLACLRLEYFYTDAILRNAYTEITLLLKNILITDLNQNSVHSTILSIIGRDALNCHVIQYNKEKAPNYSSDDMKIKLTVGCVKIVFLNLFVMSILNFVNKFQDVKDAVATASAAVVDAAKENVVENYKKATKLKFDIQVKAPILVIPIDSKSLKGISFDLGLMNITNILREIHLEEDERSPAVIDDMKIDLRDIKMYKVSLLQTDGDISMLSPTDDRSLTDQSANILDPISFDLRLQRNLSSDWYKDKPELDISGHLHSVQVQLSIDDYNLVMAILNKNLTEGQEDQEDAQTPELKSDSSKESPKQVVKADITEVSSATQSADLRGGLEMKKLKTYDQLKFNFQFDGVVAKIFKENNEGLATFGLHFLSVKGKKCDDGTLSTSIVLCDIQIDDNRPTSTSKIKRYLGRKEGATLSRAVSPASDQRNSTEYMLEVIASIKENDTYADVRVCAFDLILCVDFLRQVGEFFTTPMQENAVAKPDEKSVVVKAKTQKPVSSQAKTTPVESKMKLVLHIEEPDIILIESLDDMNSNAIILNAQINLNHRQIGEKQNISGEIKELKMYICSFMPEKREATKHYIIHPCVISLNGVTPERQGLHLSLDFSDICINISPATIELINKALTTVTSNNVDETLNESIETNYFDIWSQQRIENKDFWFIKYDKAYDALDFIDTCDAIVAPKREKCTIKLPSVMIVFENGIGYYTSPMLFIETSFSATVRDWSQQMSIDGSLNLSMQYFNNTLAVWEPLIEPNERLDENGLVKYDPWELNFSLEINSNDKPQLDDTEPELEIEARTKIKVYSEKTLELTISKTCCDLLQELGEAFSQAMDASSLTKPEVIAPFVVQNDTGFPLHLDFSKGNFTLHDCHTPKTSEKSESVNNSLVFQTDIVDPSFKIEHILACTISPGGRAYLQTKKLTELTSTDEANTSSANDNELRVHAQVEGTDKQIVFPVSKSDKRYFCLSRDKNHDPWGIVSEVTSEFGTTKISIHGVVTVRNHFTTTVSVYRKKDRTEDIFIGDIPAGESFHVPLHSVYADSKELYFALPGYRCSISGIKWNDCPTDASFTRHIHCDPIGTFEPLNINAIRERTEIFHENTSKFTILSAFYTIHLRPPLYLRNALPIEIKVSVAGCSVQNNGTDTIISTDENDGDKSKFKSLIKEDFLDYGEKTINPGDVLHLPTVKVAKKPQGGKSYIVVRLIDYLEKDWSCTTEITENHNEFEIWTFTSYCSVVQMDMDLGIRFENRHGSLMLTIFSPFWMINKTGLMLSYKTSTENANVLYHPPEYKGPILLSFREKYFFDKKRAFICVDNGEWSDKIPLDVAGSMGQVTCKNNGVIYQIGVHNHLSSNSLTKQITLIPFYTIINKCGFALEVQDYNRPADPWTKIESNDCSPLWPVAGAQNFLVARVCGETQKTVPFDYSEAQCTLLKLENNKYGGIYVDVQTTEGGIYITLTPYQPGDAPGLLINHTNQTIHFKEKGNPTERSINPKSKLLFTWADNTAEKTLTFKDGDKDFSTDLRRDGVGRLFLEESIPTYWVSFLDGLQRVLLFTDSEDIAHNAESSSSLQKVNEEIGVSIHGIGVSVLNNINQVDVLYLGITSSGVIWKQKKAGKKRFKQMKIEETTLLEQRYQEYLADQEIGHKREYFLDVQKTKIDFDQMILYKTPERHIQRTFYPGVWIQLKTSPYQKQIHAKVNRIQIDNQLTDCIFPVVLAPIMPPKSVAETTTLKPFLECSVVERIIPNSSVKQFKYCRILIQEFHVKVDLLFVTALADMFSSEVNDEQAAKLFNQNIESIKKPLSSVVLSHSVSEQKHFYDNLHLGPLKMHVSFSMAGSDPKALPAILAPIIQSVGVTLTDVNDVVFKLAFFEREYQFFTQKQLTSEISSHYAGQALKQLYVLVLGLDVLGNPYGLVVGLTKGVEDLFYEPFQGAIQGPGEFAEGLVLGVKSLFGHTLGGAAGAVSQITGAMGKCLAVLTFDEDYQKKRRQALNKKPANFNEGIARSGKGLVMGVVDGVTGVFTKPVSGAREEGVGGFFKGLGQGAIGLVARPTAGVVDFASGSFDAVKRATKDSEDAIRLRPPRFFSNDNVLRPYNRSASEGNKLLKEIEKGKYAQTDIFAHCEEVIEKQEVLLLSNNRVIYATKNDIFGTWTIRWTYRWSELSSIVSSPRGVEIVVKKNEQKRGMFSSSAEVKKCILIPQKTKRDRLADLMESLRKDNVPTKSN